MFTKRKKVRRRPKKRIKILDRYKKIDPKTGKKVQVETKPEAVVRHVLLDLGVEFKKEYGIKFSKWYRVYDYLVQKSGEYCFLVEIDGDYFHSINYHEGKVMYSELSSMQKRNVRNDKLKDRIAKGIGFPLLRFWERDIKFRPLWVREQIESEIKRQKKDVYKVGSNLSKENTSTSISSHPSPDS